MINGKIEVLNKTIDVKLTERYVKTYNDTAYLSMGGVGSVIRQVMKELLEYKNIWIKTESYSGGNSVDINFEDLNDYELAKSIGQSFEMGSFNGMEDIYEYKEFSNKLTLENGITTDCQTKWCVVSNQLRWDIEQKRKGVKV